MSHRTPWRAALAGAAALVLTGTPAASAALPSTADPATGATGQIKTNGPVYAVAVGPTKVFLGGTFTTVTRSDGSTVTRNRIAAIDRTTGQLDPTFNPNLNNNVYALAVSGATVYAGGDFTTVGAGATGSAGATGRSRVARLDQTTGQATPFKPDVNNSVYALAVSGSTVYAGGLFTQVAAGTTGRPGAVAARNRIAGLDESTGLATPFDPQFDGSVYALSTTSAGVYAGGSFTSQGAGTTTGGASSQRGIVLLDPSSGKANVRQPSPPNGTVYAIGLTPSTLYIGGAFTAPGSGRTSLAAIDRTSGGYTAFSPGLSTNNTVNTLVVSGSTVYVEGIFTSVAGGTVSRSRLAGFDATSGAPTSWNPANDDPNAAFSGLAADGAGRLYVGCQCTSIGGVSPTGFARFTDPGVATAVGWRGGQAKVLRRGVRLTWATGAEQDLLGFDVVRVRHGRRTKVNGTLIAASGLTTSEREGSSYAFTDRGGRRRDRYRLVAVDLDGRRTAHVLRTEARTP